MKSQTLLKKFCDALRAVTDPLRALPAAERANWSPRSPCH